MRRTGPWRFLAVMVVAAAVTAATVMFGWEIVRTQAIGLLSPVSDGPAVELTIPRGASTREVALLLKEHGIIRHATAFEFYAKWRGLEGEIRAGDYLLSPADDTPAILGRLVRGEVRLITFTVPEGLTVGEIAAILAAQGIVDEAQFLEAASDPSLLPAWLTDEEREQALHTVPLEGLLFPDTYHVSRDLGPLDIVRVLRARMDEVMAAFGDRPAELGFTPREALTLASIVEREARMESERDIISGVFHNRLALGMRLEACSTVQYVLPVHRAVLTWDDTRFDSAYNTYLHGGLPPGPICAPGQDSLRAALHPQETPFLYFVANDDGSHVFSRTYNEHLAAQRRIQGR